MATRHQRSRFWPYFAVCAVVAAAAIVSGSIWVANRISSERDAWRLTYETDSVSGAAQAVAVRYGHNPSRYKDAYRYEQRGTTNLPWVTEVDVNTGQKARLEVTPAPGALASCRILLDRERVVAQGKSPRPGAPAICDVKTSSTAGKWPHS